jgi:hypothetical protein
VVLVFVSFASMAGLPAPITAKQILWVIDNGC